MRKVRGATTLAAAAVCAAVCGPRRQQRCFDQICPDFDQIRHGFDQVCHDFDQICYDFDQICHDFVHFPYKLKIMCAMVEPPSTSSLQN